MLYRKSSVCVIGGLVCMGCCGRNYRSREELAEDIRKNTREFEISETKTKFRDRANSSEVRSNGICYNLIFRDNMPICPLHPALNNKDLRVGHCDVHYLCRTAEAFESWDKGKRQEFKDFILRKNLDWYEFSIGMDQDKLLFEFENRHI